MTEKDIQKRFDKYGKENCREAYHLNRDVGEGCMAIACYLDDGPYHWKQVDAMINTWEAYLESKKA